MSILASLYSGISGLAANGNAMSVIGNNIANNNTIGFKTGRTLFSDLLASNVSGSGGNSQVGRGVGLSVVDNVFSQGTFENTESNTDLAIEGEGFFVVKEPLTNQDLYTRAGSFRFDEEGRLVTPEGFRVMGYALAADGSVSGDLTTIKVDTQSLSPPRATTNIKLTTNLDADAAYRGPFNIADPVNTSNYASSVTIYDSLGNEHLTTMYFSKMDPATNPLEWEWTATIDGTEVGGAAGPMAIGSGSLQFDATGSLVSTVPANPLTTAGVFSWANNANPAQQMSFTFNTTQYSSESVVIGQSQDGYTTGSVAKLTIDAEGNVLGNFSNGLPKQLFRIALAKFTNPAGLVKEGANVFTASQSSGAAVVGTVGSGIGKIFTNSLEMSNVDLAGEFVKMITTQRGFQASSKIITATDEMLSELINLKR
ncbi:flagellar hook protein FlgE [Desulfuromonas versatilis]|uniref:Flagellar hook protein FlgE n=1 Tax=Desulfuromonas versatilis TaxID=2802975 RepID=A0ABM8I1S6_9BACT|nr:flagellar hook protein FlgE [Desulfuromonas versatilis]BCR06629.1 flagellar hook protein FlgE [Desulfuromonas versatilis]